MPSHREKILMIEYWKQKTGESDIDMHKVAELAARMGWTTPKPPDPIDLLAKDFSRAAREDIRHDDSIGRPYRGYHAIKYSQGSEQLVLWVDIDEANRKKMSMSLTQRREQMVGDALQVSYDADHWNAVHPDEEPINIELDFGPDVEWRKNSPTEDDS